MSRSRSTVPSLAPLFCLALVAVACTSVAEDDLGTPLAEPTAATEPDEPDPEADGDGEADAAPSPRDCAGPGVDEAVADLTGEGVEVAYAALALTHRCADTVVVAPTTTPSAASLAAPLAASRQAPLLLVDPDGELARVREALDRLGPEEVVTVGLPEDLLEADVQLALPPQDGDVEEELALAVVVAEELDASRALAFTATDRGARAAALSRAGEGLPLVPLPDDAAALETAVTALPTALRLETIAGSADEAQALAGRLVDLGVDAEPAGSPRFATAPDEVAWLADPDDELGYAVAAAAAGGRGETLLPVDGSSPWQGAERTDRLREVAPQRVALVGTGDADAARWQLPAVLEGEPLPTGAFTLFETERMVALYGTPSSTVLGALGEQDLDATVARAREVAEPYGADGREVVPTFEIIVTIASAEAGDRGDYSRRLDPASFRPWIDRAAEEGFYVVLDLQPGRTDFLSQAQEYEELLREPHVGLALDPEWRLEDDQVHLRQIGSVDAVEVQEVADWLAALVREHHLPQKLLVLHQFRFSMLPDRDDIVAPPELAVVVHMDGQGPIGDKYDTYAAITAGAEDRWWWGWKNFYDEDHPTPTPEQVLELDPLPVFVSYQ